MEVLGFHIKNKTTKSDGSIFFDLYYHKEHAAHISIDADYVDAYCDFKSHKADAIRVGEALLQHYPNGIDSWYLYDDIGDIGVKSIAAYAGDYGKILFLVKQLLRLHTLAELYQQHHCEGNSSVVVYTVDKHSELREIVIPNNAVQRFKQEVAKHGGAVTFVGSYPRDFDIYKQERAIALPHLMNY